MPKMITTQILRKKKKLFKCFWNTYPRSNTFLLVGIDSFFKSCTFSIVSPSCTYNLQVRREKEVTFEFSNNFFDLELKTLIFFF